MKIDLNFDPKDFRLIEAVVLLALFSLTIFSEHFQNETFKFIGFLVIVAIILIHYFMNIKKDEITIKKAVDQVKNEPK